MIKALEGTWQQDSYGDVGPAVYHDPSLQPVEVSLPHILNVNDTRIGGGNVNLFNASENYMVSNYGNAFGVTITYLSNNPQVPFTYNSLLGSIITEPMQIGLIRIQAVTSNQISEPLNLLDNVGVGKFSGNGLFPMIYPNQFIHGVAYVEKEFVLNDNLGINYNQRSITNPNVQFYFYQNASVSLDRAFSNKKIVQEYAKPQSSITQQTQIVYPVNYGLLLRSSGLL